jgi:hypothetical protein
MMRTSLETKLPVILVGLVLASMIAAVAGMSVQLAWVGQPLGSEGGTVGDVSTGIFLVSCVATFVFAARTQGDVKPTGKRSVGH